jgi:hyperosmotically inducible periplasmic protein
MRSSKFIAPAVIAAAFIVAPAVALADEPPAPHSDSIGAALSDTAITAKVKTHLHSDKRFSDSDISVKTTNAVVTLTGTAPSADTASAAEEVAQAVSGVKSVDNEIKAPSRLETAAAGMSDAAHKTRKAVSDDWITTKIKSQLVSDHSVQRGSDISVTTKNGVVMLSGTAASKDARDQAQAVARNVKGVKSVDASQLRLASSD